MNLKYLSKYVSCVDSVHACSCKLFFVRLISYFYSGTEGDRRCSRALIVSHIHES